MNHKDALLFVLTVAALALLFFLAGKAARSAEPAWIPMQYSLRDWHEDTHEVHSRLRQQYGPGFNALYDADAGKAVVLREPRITLADVAREVPQSQRGSWFALYLTPNPPGWRGPSPYRQWFTEPLYVLDEYGSYLNGISGSLRGFQRDLLAGRLAAAKEFRAYSDALATAVRTGDPGYDHAMLAAVLSDQAARLAKLTGERTKSPAAKANVSPSGVHFLVAYSGPGCPWCDKIKPFWREMERHIRVVYVNIANPPRGMRGSPKFIPLTVYQVGWTAIGQWYGGDSKTQDKIAAAVFAKKTEKPVAKPCPCPGGVCPAPLPRKDVPAIMKPAIGDWDDSFLPPPPKPEKP